MAGSYCYYPVAGYGQVAEIVGVAAQTAATAYQIYLQNLMAKRAEHEADRARAAAQAQAQAQASAQMKAATVVGQQAALQATGGGFSLQTVPTWVWLAGAGGLGLLFVMGRRR